MISLPNELLMHIIQLTERQDLREYLFVCKYTWQLVRQRVYRKVIFPDNPNILEQDVISFCRLYGQSIETIKLPQARYFPDIIYQQILQLCPNLDYLQSSIFPKQLKKLHHQVRSSTCFMTTEIPVDLLLVKEMEQEEEELYHTHYQTITYFPCCPSFFIFPSESILHNNKEKEHQDEEKEEEVKALTQISHYFHHPGALSNAILPTFGSDLLALTLNPYDVLTASVARLIVSKCPRLRYLVVPSVKAEGLWMLLRWCQTLATIIVGDDDENNLLDDDEEEEEEDAFFFNNQQRRITEEGGRADGATATMTSAASNARYYTELENERAVETIKHHKRVWCVHSSQTITNKTLWHIGIIPKV